MVQKGHNSTFYHLKVLTKHHKILTTSLKISNPMKMIDKIWLIFINFRKIKVKPLKMYLRIILSPNRRYFPRHYENIMP